MGDLQKNSVDEKIIYLAGAIAAMIVLAGTVADIVLGSILGADLTALPQRAVERFIQFNKNPLLGLYFLDMLNVCNNIITIPVFFALFTAHRRTGFALAGFALLIFVTGNTIFIANNAALPMFDLALKYTAADEAQRTLFAAAGEALLAKGAHGSLGVFPGFILPVIACIFISIAMLTGRIFSRANAYTGIVSNALLCVYLILVTFIPETKAIAMIIALPGGLLNLAWMIMIAVKLFRLGKKDNA